MVDGSRIAGIEAHPVAFGFLGWRARFVRWSPQLGLLIEASPWRWALRHHTVLGKVQRDLLTDAISESLRHSARTVAVWCPFCGLEHPWALPCPPRPETKLLGILDAEGITRYDDRYYEPGQDRPVRPQENPDV